MNLQLLKEELVRYEGHKDTVYLDTLGLATVGIGHMDKTMVVGKKYTPAEIDAFYIQDVANAVKLADSLQLNLTDVRYRVLVQLCFNLGNKITQFKRFLAACRAKDYARAADELQNSKWFAQTGRRGPETCFAMRTGAYGWRPTQINLP